MKRFWRKSVENNESAVEQAKEPKINDRFGIRGDQRFQSSMAFKAGVGVTASTLCIVLLMRTPEKPTKDHSAVNVPEASQISAMAAAQNLKLDEYSAPSENEKIKDQNRTRSNTIVVRLPGLQKIDRQHSGSIPPGSMVKAILLTGASNGAVRAEIKESLRVQGETLVPAEATVLGHGQSTEDRLIIKFNQIIYRDGSFANIQAQAVDADDKIVGLHGSKVGSYALKFAAAIGLNFVSGMSEGLQEHDAVANQVVNRADVKNALLSGASKATTELANDTMNDIKSKPPTIEVPAEKEIYILFESIH